MVLAEHLGFNTKSRMSVMMLRGPVLQVYGPVWQIERSDGGGAVLWLGTGRDILVRANFASANDLEGLREDQEAQVIGTLDFRGSDVILEDAHLTK
jgi:hypothetical protein